MLKHYHIWPQLCILTAATSYGCRRVLSDATVIASLHLLHLLDSRNVGTSAVLRRSCLWGLASSVLPPCCIKLKYKEMSWNEVFLFLLSPLFSPPFSSPLPLTSSFNSPLSPSYRSPLSSPLAVLSLSSPPLLQLMRMQPDVNLANEHGNTPLHYASFWNFIGICEVRVEVQSQDFRWYNLR